MPGVMLVKQKVADVAQWNKVFRDPELDEVRRSHGLAVTGTYLDGEDADTIIVVMAMDDMDRARASPPRPRWHRPASAPVPSAPPRASGTGQYPSVDMGLSW